MKMKKILSLLMAAMLLCGTLFALTSCGGEAEPVLKVIDIPLTDEEYAFCVQPGNDALLSSLNAFLAESKTNGTFADIVDNYFGDGTPVGYNMGKQDESKDQLVVATNTPFEPFEYTKGNQYYGIDIEMMAAFANYLGKELVILEMDFDAIFTAVNQGIADIGAAGITYDESREDTVTFSDTYYVASQVIIVNADDTTFDGCKTAEDVVAILSAMGSDIKAGAQTGTTGELYIEGDDEFGFAGYNVSLETYNSGAMAVEDMINGNINFVVLDEGPAKAIVNAKNN
jgi:polar amino acid transport system substrate-binding protein